MSRTHLDPELARAIRRQVSRSPRFDRYSRHHYGIPGVKLLGRVAAGEHGGQNDYSVRSSAGARGPFQFIGSTRRAFMQKYHVDPWKNADQAAKAAIIHIMSTGLKGYNPGMPTYTSYIMGQRLDRSSRRILQKGGGSVGNGTGGTRLSIGRRPRVVGQPGHMDTKSFLVDYLRDESPNKSLSRSYLDAARSGQYDVPSTLRVKGGKLNKQQLPGGKGPYLGGGKGKLLGHPIDRPGVSTKHDVLAFARAVASVYGHPIRLGTGTQHSQMTVNGNVSDHWGGHALDLPASGQKLIAMGRAALIAAGWSRKRAMSVTGGLFNVNGHQIIFNTQEGGDHTDHLHISA